MTILIKGSNLTLREARVRNPVPILKRIGAVMKGRVASTFKTQGRGGVSWRARGVPNIIGIIKDMEAGRKSIFARRFEPRPAGRDFGILARSINYRVEGTRTVVIGSAMSYASDFQKGGVRRLPISMTARRNLAVLVDKARTKLAKGAGNIKDRMISDLGWLLYRSQLKITVPPRPFVFFAKGDREDIRQMVLEYVKRPDQPPGARLPQE